MTIISNSNTFLASSPLRISFAGGGSDINEFFDHNCGATISATINLYSHCKIKKEESISRVISKSLDFDISFNNLEKLKEYKELGLIYETLKYLNPRHHFSLELYSDVGLGSGLGASSALVCSILKAFYKMNEVKKTCEQLAKEAYHIERVLYRSAGGWQDQYATAFGGINFIEYSKENIKLNSIKLSKEAQKDLEHCLILCDSKIYRDSSGVQKECFMNQINKTQITAIKENVKLANTLKDELKTDTITNLGTILDKSWHSKKKYGKLITSRELDFIYNQAKEHGAIGAKLLGAGNGGHFLFYVLPKDRSRLLNKLIEIGLKQKAFKLENKGTKVREILQ